MALLHLLVQLQQRMSLELTAVHAHHRLRGAEADADADVVRNFAKALGVRFELVDLNIPALKEREGGNLQEIAREARYAAFADIAANAELNKIALAHHADDQAETLLMRLISGASPSGLGGMQQERQINGTTLVRPLLPFYKQELLTYCEQHRIAYCEDSSNHELHYFRNLVRLQLMPQLKQWNEQITKALTQTAQLLQEDEQWLTEQTIQWVENHTNLERGVYTFSRRSFRCIHIALQRRVIKLLLTYLYNGKPIWDFGKLESLRAAIVSEAQQFRQFDIGENVQAVVQYDEVMFGVGLTKSNTYTYQITQVPAIVKIGETGAVMTFELHCVHEYGGITDAATAVFDWDELAWPLTLRNRRPGDRMAVLGLNGTKKVKDIFIDNKIKASERDQLPLIIDAQGQILWIPHVRRSRFAPITKKTSRILHINYQKNIV